MQTLEESPEISATSAILLDPTSLAWIPKPPKTPPPPIPDTVLPSKEPSPALSSATVHHLKDRSGRAPATFGYLLDVFPPSHHVNLSWKVSVPEPHAAEPAVFFFSQPLAFEQVAWGVRKIPAGR